MSERVTRGRRTITGLVLVVVGALLGLLALTALPWFRGSLGRLLGDGSQASDLRRVISFYQHVFDPVHAVSFWVAPVYFSWLALVLLVVSAIGAAATVGFDPRASRVVAWLAALVAVAGFVLTAFAIKLVNIDRTRLQVQANPPGYLDYLGQTGIGAWAMALGFLAIAGGALLAAGGRESFRRFLADDPEADEPDEAVEAGPSADPVALPTESSDVPVRRPREDW